MKKCKKIIAALLMISICLVSAGCVSVKDLRKIHGIWTDETHSVIELNGQIYKRLPFNDEVFNLAESTLINVTEKDVPLLIAASNYWLGDYCLSKNGIILEDNYTNEYISTYYCRSDHYDTLVAEYQKGVEYTRYGYTYYDIDAENDKIYELTEEQAAALKSVINDRTLLFTPPRIEMDGYSYGYEYGLEALYDLYDFGPSIECYSEDLIFGKYYCDICYDAENDRNILIVDNETGTWCYNIPLELTDVFEEILIVYESY